MDRAFSLGLAALLGENVYNFGELVSGKWNIVHMCDIILCLNTYIKNKKQLQTNTEITLGQCMLSVNVVAGGGQWVVDLLDYLHMYIPCYKVFYSSLHSLAAACLLSVSFLSCV